MAVGPKGSGKSSFFNNMIGKNIVKSSCSGEIDLYMMNIECDGTIQKIAFIDTPGFGTTINDESLQESIVDYIKEQFNSFIEEESKIRRNHNYEDTRVHCLLYFIPSSSYGLKPKDISFLKKVNKLVNIIPIISKSDGLSIDEISEIKALVVSQLKYNKIDFFNFEQEDFPLALKNLHINEKVPFLSINSIDAEEISSLKRHPAGTIDVTNSEICDSMLIRELLLSSYIELLIDTTSNELYERYRTAALESAIHD